MDISKRVLRTVFWRDKRYFYTKFLNKIKFQNVIGNLHDNSIQVFGTFFF